MDSTLVPHPFFDPARPAPTPGQRRLLLDVSDLVASKETLRRPAALLDASYWLAEQWGWIREPAEIREVLLCLVESADWGKALEQERWGARG